MYCFVLKHMEKYKTQWGNILHSWKINCLIQFILSIVVAFIKNDLLQFDTKKIKMVVTKYHRDGGNMLCLFVIFRSTEITATEYGKKPHVMHFTERWSLRIFQMSLDNAHTVF